MIAIFAGSFDPLHNGHLDVIERGAALFTEVRVALARNPGKNPRFSLQERTAMIEASVQAANVSVESFDGLIVEYAREFGSACLLRGIRNGADLDYENQMAVLNRRMAPDVDTIYLPSDPSVAAISSTYVRQISAMGGDVSPFVPTPVLDALNRPREEP